MQTKNSVFLLFPDFIFPWQNAADCRENNNMQLGINFNTMNRIIFKLNSCTINDRISKLPNYLKYNIIFMIFFFICNLPAGLLHSFLALPKRKCRLICKKRRATEGWLSGICKHYGICVLFLIKNDYLAFHRAHIITPLLSSNLRLLLDSVCLQKISYWLKA